MRLHVVMSLVLVMKTSFGYMHTVVGAEGIVTGTEEFLYMVPVGFGACSVVSTIQAHRCELVESEY